MRTFRHAPWVRSVAWMVTAALWCTLIAAPAAAQPSAPKAAPAADVASGPTLAVLQVTNQSGSSIQNLGSRAAAALNERFTASKRFRVLGQDAVDKAVTTVGARLPLRADARDGGLLKIAQALGADYMVMAAIDSVEADVAQKMAVVRTSTKVFGRAAEAFVCETEITALNLDRANSEPLLIDDALEQNALQIAKDVATQLSLRGRVLSTVDFSTLRVQVDQRDYLRPGTLLSVLRNGLKIATLKVKTVSMAEALCEIVERDRPDTTPGVNDVVIVYREATMTPGTGRADYDPGTGQPIPPKVKGHDSGLGTTVIGVLAGVAAVAAGWFLLSNSKDIRADARTPKLVAPVNNATVTVDSSSKLTTPFSFVSTTTIYTDQHMLQVASDPQFQNVQIIKTVAGSTQASSTSSTTSGDANAPKSTYTYTPDTTSAFLSGGTYYWRVVAVSGQKSYPSATYTLLVNQAGSGGNTGGVLRSPDTVTALAGNANVEVQWTPVTGAAYYHVMRRLLTPRAANSVTPGRLSQPSGGSSAWLRSEGRRVPRTARSSRDLGLTRQTDASLAGFSELTKVGPTVLSFSDSGVSNGTEYQYVVLSEDGRGQITPLVQAQSTSYVRVTPLATRPPAVPTNLAATPGNGQVTLTWTANTESDLAGYQVFRATSANGNFVDVTSNLVTDDGSPASQKLSAGPGDVSVVDTGITNGVSVYYRIRAVQMTTLVNSVARGGLTSALSDAVTATPSTSPPQELQVVQPPNGSTIDADRPQLTWRGVSGATEYTVQVATDANFTQNLAQTTSTSTDMIYPVALPALTSGTTYYLRVGVYDTNLQALRFGQTSSFTQGTVARYATTVLTTQGGTPFNGAKLSIDGVEQSDLTPAQVIMVPKSDGSAYTLGATFNDINGTRYTGTASYRPGVDAATVTIDIVASGVAPSIPTGLTVTGETDRVVLRWNPDPGLGQAGVVTAQRYSIQRRANTAEGQFTEIAIVTGPTVTTPASAAQLIYPDVNVTLGTRYFYRLVAISAANVQSVPSVTADGVAGVGVVQVITPQNNQSFSGLVTNAGQAWTSVIEFGWIKVPSAVRYVFEIGYDSALHNLLEGGNKLIAQSDLPSTTVTLGSDAPTGFVWTDNGTADMQTLYWRVVAVDDQNRILNQTEARRVFVDPPGLIVVPTN
ncbi:MAG: hypothetical protein HZB16_06175 [Armatimonadetes bacterium]|nr:hypothetical protein [Armatimonadota bacterium]